VAAESIVVAADLLAAIREEAIGLLLNRYIFRTHQEIVRRNPRLQGVPRITFAKWTQTMYGVANAIAVRRLASATYEEGDVNLVKLLDMLIREPGNLSESFQSHYPQDIARMSAEMLKQAGQLPPDWRILACRRLLGEDRKAVINAAEKANRFASKRAAHSVPNANVHATFSHLDDAVDAVKEVAEKYTSLILTARCQALEALHHAGKPTVYPWLVQMEKNVGLLEEMKRRKLTEGWDSIFLEPWATPEDIADQLGEIPPPSSAGGN